MGRMVRTSIPIHFQHTSIVLEILEKKNQNFIRYFQISGIRIKYRDNDKKSQLSARLED